jgi:hypothetical protein
MRTKRKNFHGMVEKCSVQKKEKNYVKPPPLPEKKNDENMNTSFKTKREG